MFDLHWGIILGAFILDFLIGDPRWLPHPVVYMGRAISFFEPVFRRMIKNRLVSGAFFSIFLVVSTWCTGAAVVKLAHMIGPWFSMGVQVVLLFYCFSSKSLEKAAMKVCHALEDNDILKARQRVAMIVGRQTQTLDEIAVTRASVETVAENFVDGFLSPLFFFIIGGVPLALAYKMINTLDSMVGYKNDTYLLFGRASAKIDDLANYIPARISVLIVFVSAIMISTKNAISALGTGSKEGRRHKSPNAGYPEAAFAGALQVRLGGPNMYHGIRVNKPYIGSQFKNPENRHIRQACDLMLLGALISTLTAGGILVCVKAVLH